MKTLRTFSLAVMMTFALVLSGIADPPAFQILWPQNLSQLCGSTFTCTGVVNGNRAIVKSQIIFSNGDPGVVPGGIYTNVQTATVEPDGNFSLEDLPLNQGTNYFKIEVVDTTGNVSTTNLTVIQSQLQLAINPVVPASQLWQSTVNLTGTISDPTYAVWVNGVKGFNHGDGTWSASNVPVNDGGTANFHVNAYAPNEQPPDGSTGKVFTHRKSSGGSNANSTKFQAKTNPTTKATIGHERPSAATEEAGSPKVLNIDQLRMLGDWRAAVANLKQVTGLPNTWNMSQSYTNRGIPLEIEGANGRHATLHSNVISIQTDETRGEIYRIDIENSWMSLADIRSFGTKLLGILGKDDASFFPWCDKSEAGWNPNFFNSVFAPLPHSDKIYGFQVLPTYHPATPWRIVLVITDPN